MRQRADTNVVLENAPIGREALRAPELLALPAGQAVEIQFELLLALAPLEGISLWTNDATGSVTLVRSTGELGRMKDVQRLACEVLAGDTLQASSRKGLVGLPIGRRSPSAALVGRADQAACDRCLTLMSEAVPMLDAIVERDALLNVNAEVERALAHSSERKLARLGFDIHDGPIQELALLAQDLRLFAGQLNGVLGQAHEEERRLVQGRLEDLQAQVAALEDGLRGLSNAVHSSALLNRPFRVALKEIAAGFSHRSGIKPQLTITGDAGSLSDSQQMALLNIVQEALSNVREHGRASQVEIDVTVKGAGVDTRIVDDGRGFDVAAAMKGSHRLGLIAMQERARLLGGKCWIESQEGGPTGVFVSLQRWQPLVGEPDLRLTAARGQDQRRLTGSRPGRLAGSRGRSRG